MKSTLLVVQNIIAQTEPPIEVAEWASEIRVSIDAAFDEIAEGKAK